MKIEETIYTMNIYDLTGPVKELIDALNAHYDRYEEVNINVKDSYGDGNPSIVLIGTREETEKEKYKRENRAKLQKERSKKAKQAAKVRKQKEKEKALIDLKHKFKNAGLDIPEEKLELLL